MDNLIKQMRVKYSDVRPGNRDETGNVRQPRIPPQKTQSFKEEKKSQNWFQRRFSGQMSKDLDPNDRGEYATAVAAAAFAITSLDESRNLQERTSKGPETSFNRNKSKGTTAMLSKQFSGKDAKSGAASSKSSEESDKMAEMPKTTIGLAPSIKKAGTFADKDLNTSKHESRHEKAVGPTPSIEKTPTLADKKTKIPSASPPIGPAPSIVKAPTLADKKITIQPALPPTGTKVQSSRTPGIREIDADAWERAEMAKIRERYEKLKSTIASWEEKKKVKAKHRREKIERKLEQKRAKALIRYREEMENIGAIAGGARAQAEERRRNEELKVKEKANKIRTTGEVPTTCLCF